MSCAMVCEGVRVFAWSLTCRDIPSDVGVIGGESEEMCRGDARYERSS